MRGSRDWRAWVRDGLEGWLDWKMMVALLLVGVALAATVGVPGVGWLAALLLIGDLALLPLALWSGYSLSRANARAAAELARQKAEEQAQAAWVWMSQMVEDVACALSARWPALVVCPDRCTIDSPAHVTVSMYTGGLEISDVPSEEVLPGVVAPVLERYQLPMEYTSVTRRYSYKTGLLRVFIGWGPEPVSS